MKKPTLHFHIELTAYGPIFHRLRFVWEPMNAVDMICYAASVALLVWVVAA